MLEDNTELIVE